MRHSAPAAEIFAIGRCGSDYGRLDNVLENISSDRVIGRGADKLIVTFKRESRAVNVDRLVEKQGFAFWLKLETYWRRRCDLGEFACLDRGETCTCEAVFYRKRVF